MDIFKNSELVQIDGNGSIHKTDYKGFEVWKISSNYKGIKDTFEIMDSEVTINANHEYINPESNKSWFVYDNLETLLADIDNAIKFKNAQIDMIKHFHGVRIPSQAKL